MAEQGAIERGALALWAWDKEAFGYDDDIADAHWEHNADEYRSKTRVAIEAAMREPTPEMIAAWRAVFMPWPYQNNAYYALIDAALQEQESND